MMAECTAVSPLPNLSEEKRRAFAMRDFLTPPGATDTEPDLTIPSPSGSHVDLDDIEYIDGDGNGGTEESAVEETPQVELKNKTEVTITDNGGGEEMNNSCRLRRWRPVSRRARCPRIIDNLCGSGECGDDGGCTDLAERLRSLALAGAGGMSASAGELLSLAPPSSLNAATVPSSPSSPNCLPVPSIAHQSAADYFGSSPECFPESPAPPPGPRYKLAGEGPLQVCCFQHTRTVINKILSSKFLRRWETHVLILGEEHISSKTPCGLLERPLSYSSMQEVYCISRWDPARKYCLRIVMPTGSLLLQASNAYTRDQWYHSIVWRKNMMKYKHILTASTRKDVVLKELKNMVDYVMTTPLHDESVANTPLQLLTDLIIEEEDTCWTEEIVSACAPLLAERGASGDLCSVLARLCRRRPRAAPLPAALAPPVRRVLKRNVDFARAPHARRLVRDYISALSSHNSGTALVRRFVEVTHGPGGSSCPHPRAAPNLVAVALAALNDHFRDHLEKADDNIRDKNRDKSLSHKVFTYDMATSHEDAVCFADILLYMSEYSDWLLVVGGVLQPVPLAVQVLRCPAVAARLAGVLRTLAQDPRCDAHSCLTPPRTARAAPPSWLRVVSPTEPMLALPHRQLCQLWGDILGSLLTCCYRRKSFLQDLTKQLPDFLVVALYEHPAALEALSLMLEWNVTTGEQTRLEIIATLQGTELGQQHYRELCERQQHLKQIQAVGGPRRLALPVKATDEDVARLLTAGSFGNLECLSLAFTSVTSACAYHLIKLPTLRYLNLWATQFGDAGVQLIAEHLPKLQVLNLCETPVSDKGIEALAALSSLRRLNLNSTNLSAEAFEELKQRLPHLQEFDIRYTEAW